jgi:hypothetical protein
MWQVVFLKDMFQDIGAAGARERTMAKRYRGRHRFSAYQWNVRGNRGLKYLPANQAHLLMRGLTMAR